MTRQESIARAVDPGICARPLREVEGELSGRVIEGQPLTPPNGAVAQHSRLRSPAQFRRASRKSSETDVTETPIRGGLQLDEPQRECLRPDGLDLL
jgi:hypothetical protein